MKILIDARPLQTYSRFRGIGRYVDQIIELFKKEDDVFFLFFDGNDIDKRSHNRIIIKTPRRGVTLTDKIFLSRLLKKHSIDLFHSTAFALPLKLPDTKYIITIHDLTPLLFKKFSSLKNILIFKEILKSAKIADKVIAVSNSTMNDLIDLANIPDDKISVIYNPVSLELKEQNQNKEKFQDVPAEYVFYAGGFDGNKNVETLLRALNFFQKPLVVTGLISDENKDKLKKLIKNKNRYLVYFTGYVSDEELAYLYNKAKLFVFPSLYEGFGYPPLEALKNGTPSITSRSGSLEEVMKDAAFYLNDPLDEKELSDKINSLWKDKALRDKIVSKGENVLKNFSMNRFKKELEKIYSSLTSGKG